MNTFFWGYFTTPWKRLIRTISIIIILFFSFTLFDSHSDSDKMICVFVLLSIPILSYVIEPFILRNRSIKKNTQVVIKNEESKMSLKSESMIKKNSTNIEVNNQSSLRKYFTYDNEYTNGATYFIRMIIGTISIPIFFIGIYLMSTTVYKRTFSFGLNKTLSIINCIIVPLLLFSKSNTVVVPEYEIGFEKSQ